jgi:hypothetical protein
MDVCGVVVLVAFVIWLLVLMGTSVVSMIRNYW